MSSNRDWCREQSNLILDGSPKPEGFLDRKKYLEAKIAWGAEGRLNPPAGREILESIEGDVSPGRIPDSVKEFYLWADGEHFGGFIKPGYFFRPLKLAFEAHRNFVKMALEDATLPIEFSNFWPVCSNSIGVEVGVFMTGRPQVFGVRVWESDYLCLSDSFDVYFECLLECKRQGVYRKKRMHARDPAQYLKGELEIFREKNRGPICPDLVVDGVTRFSLVETL